jgi:anti-sigma regulatory factor (Ser/Thr protein kinase)
MRERTSRAREETVQVVSRFPAEPASASAARHFVRAELCDWPIDVVFTTELLISEVVTNAVLHAHSSVEVVLSDLDGELRVEVTDESDVLPLLVEPMSSSDDHGRGLPMVRDLSDNWGIVENHSGKTVWFSLPIVELSLRSRRHCPFP